MMKGPLRIGAALFHFFPECRGEKIWTQSVSLPNLVAKVGDVNVDVNLRLLFGSVQGLVERHGIID